MTPIPLMRGQSVAVVAWNDKALRAAFAAPGWYVLPPFEAFFTQAGFLPDVSIILQGHGRASRLHCLGAGPALSALWLESVNAPKLRDFDLTTATAPVGVQMRQAHHAEIHNVHLRGFTDVGVDLAACYGGAVRDCYAWGCGVGYRAAGCNATGLHNVRASFNRVGVQNFQRVTGATIESNRETGIVCNEPSTDYSLHDIWAEGSPTDILGDNGAVITLSGANRFTDYDGTASGQPVILRNGAQLKIDGTRRLFDMPGGRPAAVLESHASLTEPCPVPPYSKFADRAALGEGCSAL
jgi:hypothetical protein